VLDDFDDYVRTLENAPQKTDLDAFNWRLNSANHRLGETLAYYRGATPSRRKIMFTFAVGFAGILASPPTTGASLAITGASIGIALDDIRSYVDNHGQMNRIELRLRRINGALTEIGRLTEIAV
jgi:hypothetical protein